MFKQRMFNWLPSHFFTLRHLTLRETRGSNERQIAGEENIEIIRFGGACYTFLAVDVKNIYFEWKIVNSVINDFF